MQDARKGVARTGTGHAAVNRERGEVPVLLNGRKFTLRPSYQALAEIEGETGTKIVPLAWRFQSRDFGIADQVAVLTAGLKAAGEPASPETVGTLVVSTGMLDEDLVKSINDFFMQALTGGREAKEKAGKKEKAAAGES